MPPWPSGGGRRADDRPGSVEVTALLPADPRALDDLATFLARALRADPGGVARLRTQGSVLAVVVCPLRGGGRPTVLGVRALALAGPASVDATVELAALADRLAHDRRELSLPPAVPVPTSASASWAGVLPPRSGWTAVAPPRSGDLAEAAWEVAEALGFVAPRLFDRGLVGPGLVEPALVEPALVGPGTGSADVRAGVVGPWLRLTTPRGDVLARRPLLS